MAGGRKSKYQTHVEPKLLLIEAWARDGMIQEDIAKKLGVAMSSFSEYKNKYPELTEALKRGQEVVDVQVENSLLKRAMGYRYDEITTEGGVETKRVTKEVQPDVTAQIFWLKNRKPKVWRDKQDVELSGEVKHEYNHNLRNLDPKELADLERIIAKTTDSG
ncbi:transposase [Paenibacillus sp. FSL R10-2782]|uniref:transposase n=1 Tax=Paenibacillus sp. FSL R10-2782 TaxID=2954661 RepID=UPI003158115E